MAINSARLGVVFGALLGLVHAVWAFLVAIGWAQPLINFIFWIHFIAPPYRVEAFEWTRGIILVGFTFLVGLFVGMTGGMLWNRFARSTNQP